MDADHALRVLLQLTRSLTDASSLEAALKEVTDASLELLPGSHASVRLLDETATNLLAASRSGRGVDRQPIGFRRGFGVAGWVVEHGEIARIGDTEDDPRFVSVGDQGFDIQSLLTVPLWSAGKVIGVLAVSSPKRDAFDATDEELASLLANCAVPPIERSRLQRLAITDAQTRAFNQGYLSPRLGEEIERARRSGTPLSLLMMDLDHFKHVNDTHGHAVGDVVLRTFADRVREAVRPYDILVRRGGEEFVLLMPDTQSEEARAVAERIRELTERRPAEVDGSEPISFTVSIGVATWTDDEAGGALEGRADDAMYVAKHDGRNRVRMA